MSERQVSIEAILRNGEYAKYHGLLSSIKTRFGINIVSQEVFEKIKRGEESDVLFNLIARNHGAGKPHCSSHYPKDEGKIKRS